MNARSAPAGRERSTDPPESQTPIREGEVHVWHGTLEASPDPVTPAEESRARRMGSPRRRREFLVARGALRRVLAGALGIDPLVVPIREGAHGKPHLVPRGPGLPPIGFNLSHSGDRFIVALALGTGSGSRRGADSAAPEPRPARPALLLPGGAARAVAGDPDPMHAFYRVWSRKEAVIKADGRGVSIGLDRFDVSAARAARPPCTPAGMERSRTKRRGGRSARSTRVPATRPPSPSGSPRRDSGHPGRSRPEPPRHPRLNDRSRPPPPPDRRPGRRRPPRAG